MLSPFALKTPFITSGHPDDVAPCCWWFIFANTKLLVHTSKKESTAICKMSPEQIGLRPIFTKYFGRYSTANCFVAVLEEETPILQGMEFRDLRSLFGALDNDIFCIAGRAMQIDRNTELAKQCPSCNFISYPRLSPAVIMSVVRDDKILLARSPHFPTGMYSTLAGFVEPGETLEEAVYREVLEEVAIKVHNIQYVASQPWPFPHSLMIGFTSTYVSGEIHIAEDELEDAGWFAANELPVLPSRISISRLLINNFIKKYSS